jgi:threonine synthase
VAGLLKAAPGLDLADRTVVCVITGHGLKDPETALTVEAEMTDVEPDLAAVERAMGLG